MRSGAVAEFRCHRDWTPVRGTSYLDSGYQRRISGGRRWPESAARIAHLPDHSIRTPCATRSRWKPRVLRDHARHAVCTLRHVHRTEFRSLVYIAVACLFHFLGPARPTYTLPLSVCRVELVFQ